MEGIAIVLLFTVLGGGALLVALIFAIVTGSSRSERIRRLEREQMDLRTSLNEAAARIAHLERAMEQAMWRLDKMRKAKALPTPDPSAQPMAWQSGPVAAEPHTPPRSESRAAESEAPIAPASPLGSEAEHAPPAEPIAPPPEPIASLAMAPDAPPEEATPAVVEAAAPAGDAAPPEAALPANDDRPHEEPQVQEAAREAIAEGVPARFDWERWVGVRGAAALGACILVIAGLYFFKYSIDNGLISPALRVVLGTLVGLAGVGGSERMIRRNHAVLANWLAGAGIAILYIAFWAAHGLYGLIGSPLAFVLMILVTAACGLLAVRHGAIAIALLGLSGGFATPVALSTGEDHPLGLFGYLLVLDGALLYLARRRRWPVLAALSLLGTALYQAVWIGVRMGSDGLALGMGFVVIFGGVYAFAAPATGADEGASWRITRSATVLLPFGFGLYFGLRSDLGQHVYPLASMLSVVSAGAAWVGRARRIAWASTVAAIGATTVFGSWLLVHDRGAIAWEAAMMSVILTGVFHVFRELEAWKPRDDGGPARAAAIANLGSLFALVVSAAAPSSLDPWPWLAGWLLIGGLVVRHALLADRGAILLGLASIVDLGFVLVHAAHADQRVFPSESVYLVAIASVTAIGLLSAALSTRRDRSTPLSVAAVLPFVTAVYFALRSDLGPHVFPIAIAIAVLSAGLLASDRLRNEARWTTPVSAIAGSMVLAAWLAAHEPALVPWEASLAVAAFAAVFYGFVELAAQRREAVPPRVRLWSMLAAIAGIAMLAAAASARACSAPWPWLVGWTVIGAIAIRQAGLAGSGLHVAIGAVLGVAFPAVQLAHANDAAFPSGVPWMCAALVTAIGVVIAAFAHREGSDREGSAAMRWSAHGAATLALISLAGAIVYPPSSTRPAMVFADTILLGACALVAAARIGAGGWSFASAIVAAFTHASWSILHVGEASDLTAAHAALAGQGAWVVLATAWPLIGGARLRKSAWAWRASAFAGPLSFAGLYGVWIHLFGRGSIGLLPVALGLVTFAVAWYARSLLPGEGRLRRTALVWLFAITLAAVSLAVPLQLDNEWITVGWAIEGAALLALWRRMDHAGLKYTAFAHLAAVVVRLVANPEVVGYHPRSSVPIFNWLAYTYWLPTIALLAAWYLLRDREVQRARPWEAGLYGKGRPWLAMLSGASAIVVFFVWENLTIFDAFGTGPTIEVVIERLPARDLTLSLAWAIYALFLLGFGMARRSAGLRWASLALILVTAGKVFLYDLSHLHDLYRVMSLVGLALSLMLISLAYQRFVFGKLGKRVQGAG